MQGDGELNGNALETSMDVEFTVDVIANKALMTPRVESPTHIMTVGLGGTLEDALRAATSSLGQWLEQDHTSRRRRSRWSSARRSSIRSAKLQTATRAWLRNSGKIG